MTQSSNVSEHTPITNGEKLALFAVLVANAAQVAYYLWGIGATTPQVGLALALFGPALIYFGILCVGRRHRVSAAIALAGLAPCYLTFLFMIVRWSTLGY